MKLLMVKYIQNGYKVIDEIYLKGYPETYSYKGKSYFIDYSIPAFSMRCYNPFYGFGSYHDCYIIDVDEGQKSFLKSDLNYDVSLVDLILEREVINQSVSSLKNKMVFDYSAFVFIVLGFMIGLFVGIFLPALMMGL